MMLDPVSRTPVGRLAMLFAASVACALCPSGTGRAQGVNVPQGAESLAARRGKVPDDAKSLVVRLSIHFEGAPTPEVGAGIILGASGSELYVATARHVLTRGSAVQAIDVTFFSGETARGTLLPRVSPDFDLAVLVVSGDAARLRRLAPRAWDRLGNPRLRGDDPVSPVGCPQGVCWQAPSPADRLIGADSKGILFQSSFVGPGSSGGALLNQWWEIVGMVTKDEPPRAEAIPIDQVLTLAVAWRIPVRVKRPSIPRAGYFTTVGLNFLAAINAKNDSFPDSRVPSGRLAFVRETRSSLTWHVALLRLAPDNLAVKAGLVGGALNLRQGRFTFAPFLEAGLGRVEGRFDAGGYYVASGSGNRYVPYWNQQKQDGIGVGGGLHLSVVLAPHVIVEVLAGHWSFTVPDSVPKLPTVFVGAGLRWGL